MLPSRAHLNQDGRVGFHLVTHASNHFGPWDKPINAPFVKKTPQQTNPIEIKDHGGSIERVKKMITNQKEDSLPHGGSPQMEFGP